MPTTIRASSELRAWMGIPFSLTPLQISPRAICEKRRNAQCKWPCAVKGAAVRDAWNRRSSLQASRVLLLLYNLPFRLPPLLSVLRWVFLWFKAFLYTTRFLLLCFLITLQKGVFYVYVSFLSVYFTISSIWFSVSVIYFHWQIFWTFSHRRLPPKFLLDERHHVSIWINDMLLELLATYYDLSYWNALLSSSPFPSYPVFCIPQPRWR